jgi:hypothetical protein
MKKIIATLVFTLLIAVVSATAQTDYCFQNKGLKGESTISFSMKGNKITEGEFQFVEYNATSEGEINHFRGTKTGSILTIKFDKMIPEPFKKVTKLAWTLGKNSLKIQMYGKNYQTNKWGVYAAIYEKCKEI